MRTIEQFAYTGNQIALDIPSDAKVTIGLNGIEPDSAIELTAEPIGGVATFFLDGIIRSFYKEGRYEIMGCKFHRSDRAIDAYAVIMGSPYHFVRGVAQAGRRRNAVPWTFMMTKTDLQWYEGYELGIVFCVENPDGLDWDVVSGDINGEIEQGNHNHSEIRRAVVFTDLTTPPWSTGWGNLIGIKFGDEMKDAVTLQKKSVPAHPFYVRWINELGGYDYHMFDCNQQYAYELASQTTYDMQDGDGQQVVLDKKGNQTIEVSSGMVTRQNAIAIAKLVLSPDIRWYDEKAGQWIRITAQAQSISYQTEQPTSEVVLKFVLPYQTNQ